MPQNLKSTINAKTAWSKLGEGITGLAMVAQGLLAGLMGDYLIREKFSHPDPIARGVAFAALTITAYEGKRRLITYFNTNSFADIAETDLKKFLQELATDYLRIFNYLWSIVPSLGFAYLTQFALVSSASFLRDYDINELDTLAAIFEHPATGFILSGASFISNMLSFPGIHVRGITFFKDMLKALFAPSTVLEEERASENQFKAGTYALIAGFNYFLKSHSMAATVDSLHTEKTALLADLENNDRSDLVDFKAQIRRTLNKKLLRLPKYAKRDQKLNLPELLTELNSLSEIELIHCFSKEERTQLEQHWRARASIILSLLMAAYVAIGLSNFVGIGEDMAAQFFRLEETAPKMVVGIMMMTSMCAMAMHVGADVHKWVENRASPYRSEELKILSHKRVIAIMLIAGLICALGGAPNAYQSLMIAGQGLFYIIAAAYASFALEFGGFCKLTYGNAEKKALANIDKIDSNLVELYKFLQRLQNLDAKQVIKKTITAEVKSPSSPWLNFNEQINKDMIVRNYEN